MSKKIIWALLVSSESGTDVSLYASYAAANTAGLQALERVWQEVEPAEGETLGEMPADHSDAVVALQEHDHYELDVEVRHYTVETYELAYAETQPDDDLESAARAIIRARDHYAEH